MYYVLPAHRKMVLKDRDLSFTNRRKAQKNGASKPKKACNKVDRFRTRDGVPILFH